MVALANEPLTRSVDVGAVAWTRWLARSLDILVVVASLWALKHAASFVPVTLKLPWHSPAEWWWNGLVLRVAWIGLMIAYDVTLLSRFGSTPGKWLLGVRVLASDGGRPTVAATLKRSAILWVVGMGLNVVILGVVAWILAYARLESKGVTLWDKAASLVVQARPLPWWRSAIAISLLAGVNLYAFVAAFAGVLQSPITP